MKTQRIRGGYVPALDGLRGIAICCVMMMHSGFPYFQGGFVGVDIFFVLSGFLITYLLLREYDTSGNRVSLVKFYMRRALRLGPALVLLLIVLLVAGHFLLNQGGRYALRNDVLITLFYASNWFRAFDHDLGYLAHSWSLSIEEQFYILWPMTLLVLLKFTRHRRQVVQLVLIAALLAWLLRVVMALDGASVNRLYNGLDTRADSLLIGCAVGVLLGSGLLGGETRRAMARFLKYLPLAFLAAILAIGYWARWKGIDTYFYVLTLIEVISALTILYVFIIEESVLKRLLSNRVLVWIGSISYGLYLWHFPIYKAMRLNGFSLEMTIVGGSILTFAVASASYYAIERPALSLKKRFQSKAGTLRPSPA